jgi:hypothetical protein
MEQFKKKTNFKVVPLLSFSNIPMKTTHIFTFYRNENLRKTPQTDNQESYTHTEAYDAITDFETQIKNLGYRICVRCHGVTLHENIHKIRTDQYYCTSCSPKRNTPSDIILPVWYNSQKQIQYHVPSQLDGMREGEKLIIARVAAYIPLHHLQQGQLGSKGHICSFPQVKL